MVSFPQFLLLLLSTNIYATTSPYNNINYKNFNPDYVLFKTPTPRNLSNIVLKDINDFQKQPKDEYNRLPTNRQELDSMLAYSDNVPNFDADVVNLTSQQFDEIKARQEKRAREDKRIEEKRVEDNEIEVNGLRQKETTTKEDKVKLAKLKAARARAAALMTQFVYSARYKLKYGQRLRTKYSSNIEYKLGYSFALMRDIRQQQLHLFTTMDFNYKAHIKNFYVDKKAPVSYPLYDSYIQIYEKIVRLDVDMMDMIRLVKHLEAERVAIEATSVTTEITTTTEDDYL